MDYCTFFKAATGYEPYAYQEKLASDNLPEFLCVQTGAGKTQAIIVSWLYRRRVKKESLPRRLVYCLPMRTLVEQTVEVVNKTLANLGYKDIPVHVVMGGEVDHEWYLNSISDQIIIGTQDMLISSALNRGYAVSRYKWAMLFGLLNNDAFWVFDEVQLMGNTVATSAQLEAFRRDFGTLKSCRTLWVSATLEKDWFATYDFKPYLSKCRLMEMTSKDLESPILAKRMKASKTLLNLDENNFRKIAQHILEHHRSGTTTLVICNQVKRAVEMFSLLKKADKDLATVLIHSHFRPIERENQVRKLLEMRDGIIVSTQVVEAGIDISARLLYTELAPYPSIIQRLGRLNRYGEYSDSVAYWIDLEGKKQLPYQAEDMGISRQILKELENKSVAPLDLPNEKLKFNYSFVIRKTEIMDLFDTSPDVFGTDLDVSRFIRDNDELNSYVFWRKFENYPKDIVDAPARDELCPAPLGELATFLKDKKAFVWNRIDEKWDYLNARRLRPGLVVLLNATDGGYDKIMGFDINSSGEVEIPTINRRPYESLRDDYNTCLGWWESLTQHATKTESEVATTCVALDLNTRWSRMLLVAAKLHDIGKAHSVFQDTMARVAKSKKEVFDQNIIWAKSPSSRMRHSKRYFRHELVSALLLLQNKQIFEDLDENEVDLLIYLVASHHGKVRVAVKSLPFEIETSVKDGKRISLGIEEGNVVREVKIGKFVIPETIMELELIEIGAENDLSWIDITLGLLHKHGPFVLAYLEALLRTADINASRKEG